MADGAVLVSGLSYLLLSQVSSRAVTFLLNLIITRLLTPETYGLAAVQFHLINTVILFLSREGFRRGCLRTPLGPASKVQIARRTLAISALCIPVGCLVTLVTCRLALGWRDAKASYTRDVHVQAIWLQGAAAMLELLSEPLYILAAVQLRFRLRALVDTAAIVAKSATTVALLQLTALPPALALSWAQMAFAATTLLCYCAAYLQDMPSWFVKDDSSAADVCIPQDGASGSPQQRHASHSPAAATAVQSAASDSSDLRQRKRVLKQDGPAMSTESSHVPAMSQDQLLHGPTLWLCGSFALQAAEKLVLAEGSKMVMVGLQSAYNQLQGVYGLVVNLGSLVVRTAFQPFEEAAFTSFSTTGDKQQSARLLALLVRVVAIVGSISAAFGPAYAWLLLHLLYGPRWSATAAPAALSLYSWFILLLAVNGILEAYVHASASSRQLVHINVGLVVFAAAHMALSPLLVRLGDAIGLILADSFNMLLRITFSLVFVRAVCGTPAGVRMTDMVPSSCTLTALCTAFVITGCSASIMLGPIAGGPVSRMLALWPGGSTLSQHAATMGFPLRAVSHIGVGAACLGLVLLTIRHCEGHLWAGLRELQRRSEPQEQDIKTA